MSVYKAEVNKDVKKEILRRVDQHQVSLQEKKKCIDALRFVCMVEKGRLFGSFATKFQYLTLLYMFNLQTKISHSVITDAGEMQS